MSTTEKLRSKKRTQALFRQIIKKTLKRPEKLTVSQWAEKYRMLDASSNFQGRWSNDITPYLVGVMDAFNDPYIQEINFCKCTQVGGTEALLNMLGWIITDSPAPTMIVYPSDDMGKDVSNERIKPFLKSTPELEQRFMENSSKELKLKFRGMTTYIRGAGSPAKLASFAIKYLFFDEIDKMDGASKKEASPYNLAKERTKTFAYSKKIYTCSTPTLKSNYVWSLHEAADEQRQYFVPCPHCGEMITFKWKQIKFVEDKDNLMTVDERAATAIYKCQNCGGDITDHDKIKMLRKGEWRDTKKQCVGRARKVSFWINALYSRFLTWSDIVAEFLNSKDDPEQLQNFVNSWLAEPWEDTNLKTSKELVLQRQTNLESLIVPNWTKLLTGGVDVQENCMYYTIRAFGNFITSQNIAHGQVFSASDIEEIMNYQYIREDGTPCEVNLCLIDSGYEADATYDFCANNMEWALPCKGASNPMQSHFKISKVNKTESSAYGMQLIIVDGGKYKDMIASRMKRKNGKGSWMVYKGCDEEYADQVTAEHKITEKNGNKRTQVWVPKKSHADNHYLDAEVYAMAAADVLGVRMLHMQEEKQKVENKAIETPPEEKWIEANEDWIG